MLRFTEHGTGDVGILYYITSVTDRKKNTDSLKIDDVINPALSPLQKGKKVLSI